MLEQSCSSNFGSLWAFVISFNCHQGFLFSNHDSSVLFFHTSGIVFGLALFRVGDFDQFRTCLFPEKIILGKAHGSFKLLVISLVFFLRVML
eukprot:m.30445 g.30445  ORF g.30445 m.30445 type:complete len:92 (+) comp14557_c0_seq1:522-797(+)